MRMQSTKSKKKVLALIAAALFLVTAAVLIGVTGRGFVGSAQNADTLLYRLDFADASAIGKNVAGTAFADAATQDGTSLTITDGVKGQKALDFVGGNEKKNYLSLPTAMFEGQNKVTLAGWFYVPEDIGDYLGEIGIFSPADENNVAFRADPRASYHWNAYLYVVGTPADVAGGSSTGVKPVYDAWYHMAYVIDGEAHKFTVIQNGAKVYEKDLADDFSPSQYHSANAHFYLGQSAYEDNHDDYTGKMSDFRVYGDALTIEQVKAEYELEVTDFITAEYTFDNKKNPYQDAVRGYDLKAFNGTPVFEDGMMKLSGGAAAQSYNKQDSHNVKFFDGHANFTISMDLTVKSTDDWRRVMDMYANGNNRITYMSHCPRKDDARFFDAVYAKDGDNNMLGDNSFTFKNNESFNLTIVLSGTTITVWEDGVLKVTGTSGDKPAFQQFLFDLSASDEGNFTLGTCSYETHNYITADYDNIRIYAAAAETAEEVAAVGTNTYAWRVKYLSNNGQADESLTPVRKGSRITLADDVFEYDGHIFTGWNTAADGTGTAYAAGATFTPVVDTTLYAQWANAANYITFDPNGGRGEMDDLTVPFDEQETLPACAFAKTGYTFAGWNTAADGSGDSYAAGATVEPNADMTLYAVWTAKHYAVTFDNNGGTGSMEKLNLTFGTQATLTQNAFTRHGYTFGGWALTKTGVAAYTDGQSVDGIEEGNDVTLYAVWKLGTFTVTFDGNGGTGTLTNQTGDAFAYVTLTKNAFTRDGKVFQGWATQADGEVVVSDGGQYALEDDVTLYAVWGDATEPDPEPTPTPEEPPKGCGCGGVVTGASAFGAGLILIGGAAVLWLATRRKAKR